MDATTILGQTLVTPTGIAVANLSIRRLAVAVQADGTKELNLQVGDVAAVFFLDKEQCDHLAALLIA